VKFGVFPLNEAEGALLVHSLRTPEGTLRKGRELSSGDVERLRAAGYEEATLVRLEAGDVPEDTAAQRMAEAVCIDDSVSLGTAGTGRVNIYAAIRGVFVFPAERLDAINQIDEAVTLATIEPFAACDPGQLVATVKIIPFAVEDKILAACEAAARDFGGLFKVAAFQNWRVGLLQTVLPDFRASLLEKGVEVTSARLAAMDLTLDEQRVCEHSKNAIQDALQDLSSRGCDLVLVLGASAIADRRDVVPSAIIDAGGGIEQLGMPVDPGNLTLLAHIGEMAVVGLPGSARSPRLHGSDWIVQRLVAGLSVTAHDIRAMGAGGLLKEIPGRPMPRAEASPPVGSVAHLAPRVAAIVLAAGQSRRMGAQNKLLADIDGKPMVARTLDAVMQSAVASVTVVLGHEAEQVRAVLADRRVTFTDNPDFEAGLSTSLKRGLAAIPDDSDAVLICLGDMPRISADEINLLIDAFAPNAGHAICVPTYRGKRGNPVLLGRRFFAEIQDVSGDAGARYLIGAYPDLVYEVAMEGDAVLLDIDTPEALARIAD
jgi:molybdenum cofactor cytidylyltransferase